MNVTKQAQAILLLTTFFVEPTKDRESGQPLTPTEWGRFALWLKQQKISPEDFLSSNDPESILSGWVDQKITAPRIRYLLGRAGALGLSLEKWERAGLWIMTRSDPDYPRRLKNRLGMNAPAVLFGCGDRRLLDKGGIAMVGSRDADKDDLADTRRWSEEIANHGYSIVSGGARGIDEEAMLGALQKEGTVIGVLADSLLRTTTSAKYRKDLMAKNLVLLSPFNPEASFNVGNAMARNKYVYCLADAGIVVASSKEKGGTWNGAIENLKKEWVPLWVKNNLNEHSGNAALVRKGARFLTKGSLEVSLLLQEDPLLVPSEKAGGVEVPNLFEEYPSSTVAKQRLDVATPNSYETFLAMMKMPAFDRPVERAEILQKLRIETNLLSDWLRRGIQDGKIAKFNSPVRYQAITAQQGGFDF